MRFFLKNQLFLLIFTVSFLLVSGCDNSSPASHPIVKKAEMLVATEKYSEAIDHYKKYLQLKPNTSTIHLKIALIYDENIGDCMAAIYHYNEYIKLAPNAKDQALVKTWIDLCEKRFVEQNAKVIAPTTPPLIVENEAVTKSEVVADLPVSEVTEIEKDTANLVETPKPPEAIVVVEEKPEIVKEEPVTIAVQDELKEEKKDEELALPPADLLKVADKEEKKVETKPKFPMDYLVKKGDTLSQISARFYGSSRYYRDIMKANMIENPSDLRAGTIILLPKIN